jgi:leucyl aminopeptidase
MLRGATLALHVQFFSALVLPPCAAFALGSLRSAPVKMTAGNAVNTHARIVVAARNSLVGHDRALQDLANVDAGFATRVVSAASAEDGRLVLSPAGSLLGDVDDVRKVGDAAAAGAAAAFAMGATALTLQVDEDIEGLVHPADGAGAFAHAALVAKLGVLQRAYVTLQAREASVPKASPLETLVLAPGGHQAGADAAEAIEEGRRLARDIGSGDPERMTPLRLAEAVSAACQGTSDIKVSVLSDVDVLRKEYPLLMSVARASLAVERHRPCVVRLEWSGTGPTTRTVIIAGKGVTYDTGGADIKVGGGMAGMRRDKCGAAAAAGFVLACARADPALTAGLKVIVELGCARARTRTHTLM